MTLTRIVAAPWRGWSGINSRASKILNLWLVSGQWLQTPSWRKMLRLRKRRHSKTNKNGPTIRFLRASTASTRVSAASTATKTQTAPATLLSRSTIWDLNTSNIFSSSKCFWSARIATNTTFAPSSATKPPGGFRHFLGVKLSQCLITASISGMAKKSSQLQARLEPTSKHWFSSGRLTISIQLALVTNLWRLTSKRRSGLPNKQITMITTKRKWSSLSEGKYS